MELHGAPYHGFYHAVDCAQTLLVFLNTFGAQQFFSPTEAFALLIAALCHDLEHPGLSVTYQENAQVRAHACARAHRAAASPRRWRTLPQELYC